jgi:hypothetical protein
MNVGGSRAAARRECGGWGVQVRIHMEGEGVGGSDARGDWRVMGFGAAVGVGLNRTRSWTDLAAVQAPSGLPALRAGAEAPSKARFARQVQRATPGD